MGNFSFSQEPAVFVGLATAIIAAVAVFFPNFLNAEQQKAVVAVIVIAVPIALSFVVRAKVTPVASLPANTPAPKP